MVAIICIVLNMIIAWVFIWDALKAHEKAAATFEYYQEAFIEVMRLQEKLSRKKQKRVKGKFA